MSDFIPTKEQLQILEQLKEVTEPYYVFTDQMMAIAMWIDAEFKQKSKANGENKEQDKALHLRGVVFSETDNMCKTCNKPIRMYDGILQQLCECERVAEVCKCLQCYPIVTADGNLAKKCINCGIEHLQT